MPQPLHGDYAATMGARALLGNPQTAMLTAHVVVVLHEWTEVEDKLAMLLSLLLRGDFHTHRAVLHMYHSISNHRMRMDMMKAAAREALILKPDLAKEFVGTLVPDINGRARERNRIAHGRWGVADGHPDALMLIGYGPLHPSTLEPPLLYREVDFLDIEARLTALNERLHDFLVRADRKGGGPAGVASRSAPPAT